MSTKDFSDFSMFELFRIEADTQTEILTSGLLVLERDNRSAGQTEALMRAAHSLKGAARVVELDAAVRVSHAMEDCFVAAQKGKVTLGQKEIDLLLSGVDLLVKIAQTPEAEVTDWANGQKGRIDSFVAAATRLLKGQATEDSSKDTAPAPAPGSGRGRRQTRRDHRRAEGNGPRFARDGRQFEPPARPGRRIARRIAPSQLVQRFPAAAQASPWGLDEDAGCLLFRIDPHPGTERGDPGEAEGRAA